MVTKEHAQAVAKLSSKGGYQRARKAEKKVRSNNFDMPVYRNGIGQVSHVELKVGPKNTQLDGVPIVEINFIIMEPVEYKGRQGRISTIISNSEWATEDEKLEEVSSNFQFLGCNTDVDGDWIGLCCEDLNTRKPYFANHTFKAKKSGNVYCQIDDPGEVDPPESATTNDDPQVDGYQDINDQGPWQEGDRVDVAYDGELYGGNITSVNLDSETATVAFDDGTTADHLFEELVPGIDESEVVEDEIPY